MTDFSGHLPGSRSYRRLLAGLFFAGVATFAQLYSPQAVLPFIAADFSVSAAGAALSVSAATLGLAVAVLPWSIVADRIGRVPAMAAGVSAATLFGLLAPLLPTLPLLLAARLVEGIALGAVPALALAYLAEEVDARHTAAAAGSYVAGTTIGGLAGRIIAGPFGELGHWRIGVFVVALVCAGSAVLFLVLAPRARGFAAASALTLTRVRAALVGNLRSRMQWALYAQGFLLMGGFVALFNYLGFELAGPAYGVPAWLVSLIFVAYLAGTASSPWAGRLASRHGRRRVLVASIGMFVVGIALTVVPSLPVVIVGLLVFTAGFFAAHAIASGWAPVSAAPGGRAQASALYNLGYYIGSSLFGWALGLVFAGLGWPALAAAVIALELTAALIALTLLPGRGARPVQAAS
ncbi:MAG: MFS transporter [Microbacterium ginsengisoli]|uniref:MFS transporter n=1 Tax=Microbacterium TaxID=33882 RepID=UPI0006F4F85E|nr:MULTISPECIES: MFS transporter [unclassified Microbacterium]MBN9199294.1 MFS transporter [Microbacterium ginsengisoli]KQR90481.1 MFS transporter [Microbacterium sp. Leaf347]KQR91336.1 MFS transporter [Microbacterium sp. Leaf351]ODU78891.1 MAG: MFS transporter [Microbacterium sp. SCN 71-21]OJU74216.1 MAG: MFS transporter [Microbacterium sp. 71-23]